MHLIDNIPEIVLLAFHKFAELPKMPGDLAIWDLAIAANNQRLLAGDETALGRRETTLIFLGKLE